MSSGLTLKESQSKVHPGNSSLRKVRLVVSDDRLADDSGATSSNLKAPSPLTLVWLYAIIMGLGVGSWLPTMSMLVSTKFGLAAYGVIFGMITLVFNIGTGTGPLAAGYIYDTTNTYQWAFVIFLILYAVSIPTALAIRHPKSN